MKLLSDEEWPDCGRAACEAVRTRFGVGEDGAVYTWLEKP